MPDRFGNTIKWKIQGDTMILSGRGMIGKPEKMQKNIKHIIINEGIMGIDNNAFEGCVNLEDVTLPKSLMIIGEFAFADCWKLSKIGPLPSLNFIEKNAFDHSGCHSLSDAIKQAGPTFVPYSYHISSKFGDVRLLENDRKKLDGLSLYAQLDKVAFTTTTDPDKFEAQGTEEIKFEDIYKVVLDGNVLIGVVIKKEEELIWLFLDHNTWQPYKDGKYIRVEFK